MSLRAFLRPVLVLLLTVAGVAVLPVSQAVAVTAHRALNDTRAVHPGVQRVAFPVEYFGVVGSLTHGRDHLPAGRGGSYGEARFEVDGRWTDWQALSPDGAQAQGQLTTALLPVERATAYQVRGLPNGVRDWRAAAINTTDGPTTVVGHARSSAASAAAPCRSRADWGADESISGWSKGTEVQAFYDVQTLTVHHTGGSNDPNQDYAATVRAIYSYHVQTNGWSDIGYQYLVDGRGVVYEGRSTGRTSTSCLFGGGDGADFAHQAGTDAVVNGAHVAGYNAGNVGIALLGCFEASTECAGDTAVPAAAIDSLETLLGALAARHGLDPRGQTRYVNPVSGATKDVSTVSAHRDWAATACPGSRLYAQLGAIRDEAARRMTGAGTTPPPAPATITSGSCTGATCTFAGTGVGTLRWTFGNKLTAKGSPVTTKYSAVGKYTVKLTDSQSPATTATRSVTCSKVSGRIRCAT